MSCVCYILRCLCCFMLLTKMCDCQPLKNYTKCDILHPHLHLLCESPIFYPEKAISEFLKRRKNKNFQILSGTVIKPTSLSDKDLVPQVKFIDKDEYKNLCDTVEKTFIPRAGTDENGNHRFIVNVPDFRQTIMFEICVNESRSCTKELTTLPMGYHTSCQQKYSKIRLLTYIGKGGDKKRKRKFEYVTFRVPSTCVCTITKEKML
ncbi:unnamed protein product [Callosobruchus maculatus]|uniref:Spaetzle domain-containing protein n=1 Tax=Callosobruchus maculatus TaxID=64391 RepID=A0A653D6B6_CALMS|nr:unnamed protein product [Callosobruchus maculatus]